MTRVNAYVAIDMLGKSMFSEDSIDGDAVDLIYMNNRELEFDYYNYGQHNEIPIGLISYEFEGWDFEETDNPVINKISVRHDYSRILTMDSFSLKLSELEDLYDFYESKSAQKLLAGNDQINGSDENDRLYGGNGDDFVLGESGNDIVIGGDGMDTLSGGPGGDILFGQRGNNRFLWEGDNSADKIVVFADGLPDTIHQIDVYDEIIIQGASSSELSFSYIGRGVGIYAKGILEAVYLNEGTNFEPFDFMNFTRVDT